MASEGKREAEMEWSGDKDGDIRLFTANLPPELAPTPDGFAALFAMHPPERARIFTQNKWIEVPRWSKSFLKTPAFDEKRRFSDMFAERVQTRPEAFLPFMEWAKTVVGAPFSQCIVNWYNEDDRIAMHSDCEDEMVEGAPIAVVSLCERDGCDMRLLFTPRTRDAHGDPVPQALQQVFVPYDRSKLVCFSRRMNSCYRHGVKRVRGKGCRRIALSFRCY